MAEKEEVKETGIFVKYKGDSPEVFAPNLGLFLKGKSKKFTDAFQIEEAKNLVKRNTDFEEVEK